MPDPLAPTLNPNDRIQFVGYHRASLHPGDYWIDIGQTVSFPAVIPGVAPSETSDDDDDGILDVDEALVNASCPNNVEVILLLDNSGSISSSSGIVSPRLREK